MGDVNRGMEILKKESSRNAGDEKTLTEGGMSLTGLLADRTQLRKGSLS